MNHDTVLLFSKSFGAIYLLVFFVAACIWTYWPSRRDMFHAASLWPTEEREVGDE